MGPSFGNLMRLRDGNQADPSARIYGYDPLNSGWIRMKT